MRRRASQHDIVAFHHPQRPGLRLSLSADDAGRHLVRTDDGSARGLRSRRGRGRQRRLGRSVVQFPAPAPSIALDWSTTCLRRLSSDSMCTEPSQLFERLTQGTSVLALQSGEAGPFAQSIAGIDLAVWDLCARRQNVALWKLLGGGERARSRSTPAASIRSGRERMAEAALARGHRALKLKIGFDPAADRANLAALRAPRGQGHARCRRQPGLDH